MVYYGYKTQCLYTRKVTEKLRSRKYYLCFIPHSLHITIPSAPRGSIHSTINIFLAQQLTSGKSYISYSSTLITITITFRFFCTTHLIIIQHNQPRLHNKVSIFTLKSTITQLQHSNTQYLLTNYRQMLKHHNQQLTHKNRTAIIRKSPNFFT